MTSEPTPRVTSGLPRRPLAVLLAVTFVIGTSSAGCASYHALPLVRDGAASTLIHHREREGLHAAVEDLSDARSSLRHFGRKLRDHRFVPVRVLLELDSGTDDAFQLRREDLQLVLRTGRRLRTVDPQEVVDAVGFSHWRSFFGYLFLLPGPFVTASVQNANEELESDYSQKSLRSVRLSPNLRAYDGVAFFEMPPELGRDFSMDDAFVELVVYVEGRSQEELGRKIDLAVHFSD